MNEEQYLLTCIAEECAEVAHRASKMIRFGGMESQPGSKLTNAERLMNEYYQLMALIVEAQNLGFLPKYDSLLSDAIMLDKLDALVKYARYSRELGVLDK